MLRNLIIRYLPGITLTLAISSISYFGIAWVWRFEFMSGDSVGPYLLFIAVDHTILPLTLVSFLGCIVLALLVRLGRQEPAVAKSMVSKCWVLLLTSLIFVSTWPTMLRSFSSVDSLIAKGQVYRLAIVYGMGLNANYILFKCDRMGLICRNIYETGYFDIYFSGQRAELAYQSETNILSIEPYISDAYRP